MLFNTWSTLTLLALSTSVAASPAPIAIRTDVDTPFTFSQWIEGIIADPNGSHLTAEEAIAASHMKRRSDNHVKRHPYVDCMEFIPEESSFSPANAIEAAACVEMLARIGAAGAMCDVPGEIGYTSGRIFCQTDDAQIFSQSSDGRGLLTSSCSDTARAAGWIFDQCWKDTRTVRGMTDNPADTKLSVELHGIWKP